MKILIIRHGEPDYSIDSLTPKGWREAEFLAQRLVKLDITDFYCSPLGRAKDTAKPTLERLGRKVEILPWLREFEGRVIFPDTTEKVIPWNLSPQFWTKQKEFFNKDKWCSHPLMQSDDVEEVYRRTIEGFDSLLERYGYTKDGYIYRCDDNRDITIAIFCHFALGMTLLSHVLGVALPVMWQSFFMPTSSVTSLITEEREKGEVFFKCLQLGDTSHLYANDEPVSNSGLFYEIYSQDNPAGTQ